jgi:hypothetical protein
VRRSRKRAGLTVRCFAPTLDTANVVPVRLGQLGEFFLREAFLETELTQVNSERNSWVRSRRVAIIESLTTMSLHTMSMTN